jgi:hypothetical protein
MFARTDRSMDRYSPVLYNVGGATVHGNAHFQHPWYVRGVVCPDGKRRTAYANTDASTYRVKHKGVWYYGVPHMVEIDDQEVYYFHGTSTFQKIVAGYVVKYWLERFDPKDRCDLSAAQILNRCTRQTGITIAFGQVRLNRNGKCLDAVQCPRWLTQIRIALAIPYAVTYGELVKIVESEGVN